MISGFHHAEGGKLVFKMKNSWGPSFADGGYFLVECNALPKTTFFDVFFRVDHLTSSDIRNYIYDRLRKKNSRMVRTYLDKFIEIRGCGSKFDIVADDGELSRKSASSLDEEDEKGISRIHKVLRRDAFLKFNDANGTVITVDYSEHRFRVIKKKGSSSKIEKLLREKLWLTTDMLYKRPSFW